MKFVLAALVLVCCVASVYSGAIVATPLKRLFDSALIELITTGQRASLQADFPLGTPYGDYQDCIPQVDEYPYPALQRRGSFTRLLRGIESLRIGDFGSPDPQALAFTATLINIINNQYGGDLSPVWYFYETADEVFAALQYRQIDMTSPVFSLGTFFSNSSYARAYWFPRTCTVFSVTPQFVVLESSSFTTVDDLIRTRVCTFSQGWAFLAAGAIPGTNFIVADDCDSGLDSGIYDAVFYVQGTTTATGPTRIIDSGVVVPYGAFFPNRGPPVDPEPQLPEPVELSFSVQPTPSRTSTPSTSPTISQSSSTSVSESTTGSLSESNSPGGTPSTTPTQSASESSSISDTASPTISDTASISESGLPTATPSISVTPSLSESNSPTISDTASPSLSESTSPSLTPTISNTPSAAPTSPIALPSSTNPLGNNG